MTILIISGIVLLIVFSTWYAKKVDNNTIHSNDQLNKDKVVIDTTEDNPVSFGYKSMWYAIKTNNQQLVADYFELKDLRPANWRTGIENAYKDSIYITPSIDGWTLVVGWGLPLADSLENLEKVKALLVKLSSEFESAQFFGSYRVVSYYCWIKSTKGQIARLYAFLEETGGNIEILGEPIELEKSINLINTFSEESKEEVYWDRNDITYPNEELVIQIAREWSIDPTSLEDRQDIKGLGLLGRRK